MKKPPESKSQEAVSSTLDVPPTTLIQVLSGQVSNELMQDKRDKVKESFTLSYTWQS